MIPIVQDYLSLIHKDLRVLEVGCGAWDFIKKYCRTVGAHYEGIDAQPFYFGRKTVATRIENLSSLSFPNDYFDLVIGNQCMEHWAEFGCTLKWGLYQCFRVLKPVGKLLLNVPIHFHGTSIFILGKLPELEKLFRPLSSQVSFQAWGQPSAPIPPFNAQPGYWKLYRKPAYVLDIQAVKDGPLPENYDNRYAASGRLAQLLNYPPSYNLYRVLRKLRKIASFKAKRTQL
jgi:SAM-dependent methyltransferase